MEVALQDFEGYVVARQPGRVARARRHAPDKDQAVGIDRFEGEVEREQVGSEVEADAGVGVEMWVEGEASTPPIRLLRLLLEPLGGHVHADDSITLHLARA